MLYGADSDGRKRFWLLIDVFGVTRGSLYLCVTACVGQYGPTGISGNNFLQTPLPPFRFRVRIWKQPGGTYVPPFDDSQRLFSSYCTGLCQGEREGGSIRKSREATPRTANTRVLRSLMNI